MDDGSPRGESGGLTRLSRVVTTHSRAVIATILLLTAVLAVGIPAVEYDTSLDQFESQSPEGERLEYATENFSASDEANTTVAVVIVSGENVLTKESLVDSLRLQEELYENETVDSTLSEEAPIVGVENVVATGVIREREASDLRERGAELEKRGESLNETATELRGVLEEVREIQREYEQLNTSYERGEIDTETHQAESTDLEANLTEVREQAIADLEDDQVRSFDRAMASVRSVQSEMSAAEREKGNGTIDEATYDRQIDRLETGLEDAYTDGTVGVLDEEYDRLWEAQRELQAEREALESTELPPLSDQIDALESLNESAYEHHLESTLADDGPLAELTGPLLPSAYEPGSTQADERILLLRQWTHADGEDREAFVGDRLVESQHAVQQLAGEHGEGSDDEYAVFGFGLVSDEIDTAVSDSLGFVGPVALAVVLASLTIAYRDPLEVVLGVVGMLTVLVWTFGFVGWLGIEFNQLFVAIPALLIGLSIDYAIHVFMRHRECREKAGGVRPAMAVALAGVGTALVWVTATTAIGFLSNLVSPVAPLREFGLVSAFGIVAALVVFGGLLPAVKVELEDRLERHGVDRRTPALGTRDGLVRDVLSIGATVTRRVPLVVVVMVLAVTAGGLYAAGTVDTSFDQEDLLAEEPAWADRVPAMGDREYQAKAGFETLGERFEYRDSQAQIVITGDVTDGETVERIAAAREQAARSESADAPPTAGVDDRDPLSVMESVAAEDESFNASFQLADRTGDGVPNQNLEGLYDELFEIDPDAASAVIHRTEEGEYEAVRMLVSVRGDTDGETLTTEMRAVAGTVDDGTDPRWDATTTGTPIVDHVVEDRLLSAIFESLAVTLLAVVAFLAVTYHVTGHGASLGVVTLIPVVLAVPWIVGTMALLGIPFNVLTGTVASFTIGLGVAYTIHVSSRYTLELRRHESVSDALETTMAGTGGALLGSVATTALGFSTLALASLPAVRQFGIVTALTIVYAFLASVLVLPTLLVGWTRYVARDSPAREETPTSEDATEQGD